MRRLLELISLADEGKVSPDAKVLLPCGQLSLETVPKRLAEAGSFKVLPYLLVSSELCCVYCLVSSGVC